MVRQAGLDLYDPVAPVVACMFFFFFFFAADPAVAAATLLRLRIQPYERFHVIIVSQQLQKVLHVRIAFPERPSLLDYFCCLCIFSLPLLLPSYRVYI